MHPLFRLAVTPIIAIGLAITPARVAANRPVAPEPEVIGLQSGLPSTQTGDMAFDKTGMLWIATADGLARYDGLNFRTWRYDPNNENSIRGSIVRALAVDNTNRIWISAGHRGVSVLDERRNSFEHFNQNSHPEFKTDVVSQIAVQGDNVWIGTEGGLYRIDKHNRVSRLKLKSEQTTAPSESIWALGTDKRGTLWIGTRTGLASWDGSQVLWHRLIEEDGEVYQQKVLALGAANDGMLISTDVGIFHIQSRDKHVSVPWWSKKFARPEVIVDISSSKSGTWLRSKNALWRLTGTQPQRVLDDVASDSDQLGAGLLSSDQGSIFFSLPGRGIGHLGQHWNAIRQIGGPEDLAPGRILFPIDRNSFLIGGPSRAVSRAYLNGEIKSASPALKTALQDQSVSAIFRSSDGSTWYGTNRLFKEDAYGKIESWEGSSSVEASSSGPIVAIRETKNRELWIAYLGTGIQRRTLAGQILDTTKITDFYGMELSPSGDLWIATPTGFSRWMADKRELAPVAGIRSDTGPFIQFLFASESEIWAFRLGALEKFKLLPGGDWKRVDLVTQENGLPASEAMGMRLDSQGRIWLPSKRGIFIWDTIRRQADHIGTRDGLRSLDFTDNATALSSSGVLGATTNDGALVFIFTNLIRLPLADSKLALDSFEVRHKTSWLSHRPPYRVNPGDKEIRVRLRLPIFRNSAGTKYQSKLDGFDTDWVTHDGADPGERIIANLPPGQYVLHARATQFGGGNVQEKTIPFEVLPEWWQTRAARLTYGALLILLGWLAFAYYRRSLRRQEKLRQAEHEREVAHEASLAKTRFLATLGHEVRTPMTGVLGMSELMLGTPLDATQRGYMTAIHGAGEHLVRLVNDALDLSRIESGKLELLEAPFDLVKLIDEIAALLKPLAQSKGLSFEVRIDDGVRAGQLGDSSRVRQILLNLLGNAIKFTEAGRVWLDVTQPDEDCVRFEVGDTGPGLNEEQKSRLFRRFEQAEGAHTAVRYGGSGLGLAICQELAALMQGTIAVDSTPGHGARFVFDLQLHAAVLPETLEPQSPLATTPSRAVLLVEDDSIVADVIVGLLQAQGHWVTHVAHGLAAMSEATLCTFDLALLDLDLPGIDGFALARHLRAQGFDAPMVAVTARADAQVQEMALQAGCARFLRKPLSGAMLAQLIAELEQLRTQPA